MRRRVLMLAPLVAPVLFFAGLDRQPGGTPGPDEPPPDLQ